MVYYRETNRTESEKISYNRTAHPSRMRRLSSRAPAVRGFPRLRTGSGMKGARIHDFGACGDDGISLRWPCICCSVRGGSVAQFRSLQDARRTDLLEKAARPRALRGVPCGEFDSLSIGAVIAGKDYMDRGAIAAKFRNRVAAGNSGQSGDEPLVDSSTRSGCGRRPFSRGRPSIRFAE